MDDSASPPDQAVPPAGTGGEYRVLARKYRPSTFDELVGQDALVRTLTNAMTTGRLAHAFILTGVRGIGKTTTARLIARALNCVGPDGKGGPTARPCGVCDPCVAIANDAHMDVIEMDAASNAGVGEIRELIDGVRYRPTSARYKVYILDEVHMLSRHAFDALLKTLEEPPEHVKFVFATTEIRKVPVTILSRCQRFDLRRLDLAAMTAHLGAIAHKEGAEVADDALAMIARAADGSVRDGLSLLDQAIAHGEGPVDGAQVRAMLGLADRARVVDLLDVVMKGDAKAALDMAAELYAAGADPTVVVQDLLDYTHWLTRLRITPEAVEGAAVSEAERDRALAMATELAMPALTRAWQILLKGLDEVIGAPTPQAALEMLLVRLAYAAELPTPGDLVAKLQAGDGAAQAPAGGGAASQAPGSVPAARAEPPPPQTAEPHDEPGGEPAGDNGGGGPRAQLAPAPRPEPQAEADGATAPNPTSFAAAVDLFAARREARIANQLASEVHLVHFEPGRIELRLGEHADRGLVNQVGSLLSEWTGSRWVVSVSQADGAPTLRAARRAAEAERREAAADHPLVRAVLDTFPGATIGTVRDRPAPLAGDGDAATPEDEEDEE